VFHSPSLAALALCLLVGAGVAAGRWGRPGAVVLAGFSLMWLLVDQPLEGAVLFSVTSSHGLTDGDLGGMAGLLLAGWCWLSPGPDHK
jgi:hypothetical protein